MTAHQMKSISGIFITILFCFLLVACGSGSGSGTGDPEPGPTDPGPTDPGETKTASVISPEPLIISWPLTKAYPGIEYNIRLGVIGGSFPYEYTLTQGPAGMQVSDNGTVTWTPGAGVIGQSFSVSLQVRDSLNQTVSQDYSLEVTESGFLFVDDDGDDDTGNGSISHPWATINKALASGSRSDFLYVREGDYLGAWRFQPNESVEKPSQQSSHRSDSCFCLTSWPTEQSVCLFTYSVIHYQSSD